jgi:hypothetical protein
MEECMAVAASVKLPVVRNLQDLTRLDNYIEGPGPFSEAVLTDFGRSLTPPIGLSDGRIYIVFNREGLGASRQAAISAVFAKGVWKYYPGGVPAKKLVSGAGGMASTIGAALPKAVPAGGGPLLSKTATLLVGPVVKD